MNTMVYNKIPCPVSAAYNAQMPYWLEVVSGGSYGIHALDTWECPTYLENLGRPVSHGCIRLSPENARWLYGQVEIGTPVFVVYKK
jgi:lipoprotein-anchoring transpeptidase ErfK/SrfK